MYIHIHFIYICVYGYIFIHMHICICMFSFYNSMAFFVRHRHLKADVLLLGRDATFDRASDYRSGWHHGGTGRALAIWGDAFVNGLMHVDAMIIQFQDYLL